VVRAKTDTECDRQPLQLFKLERLFERPGCAIRVEGPQPGSLNRNQVSALAGLAPYNDDSAKRHGQRFIRGGRRALRNGLYMAALVAIRHHPILKSFYQPLRANGKPAKLALTAVMRKLLILLNSSLKNLPLHP